MKKYLILGAVVIATMSCAEKEKEVTYAIVEGNVANADNAKIAFMNNSDATRGIELSSDGHFSDTIHLSRDGYVTFRVNNSMHELFVSKGDHLTLTADAADSKSEMQFTGTGAATQEYLAKKNAMTTELTGDFRAFFGQEVEAFVSAIEKIKSQSLTLLDNPAIPEGFKNTEKRAIDIELMSRKSEYTGYQKFLAKSDTLDLPESFMADFNLLDKDNNEDAVMFKKYRDIAFSVVMDAADKNKDPDTPHLVKILSEVEKLKSPALKNHIVGFMLYSFSPSFEDIDAVKAKLLSQVDSDAVKERIEDRYNTIKDLTKGKPSPVFDYENAKGGKTTLADLKGNYVYIDVWATWCGPCIGEIPFLKKVEHEFEDKNITFVSISVDNLKDHGAWQKMIKEKELGGVQLFADNAFESDFISKYAIRAIPQFILLDPNGNIVSADAQRPSDPGLTETLKGLL